MGLPKAVRCEGFAGGRALAACRVHRVSLVHCEDVRPLGFSEGSEVSLSPEVGVAAVVMRRPNITIQVFGSFAGQVTQGYRSLPAPRRLAMSSSHTKLSIDGHCPEPRSCLISCEARKRRKWQRWTLSCTRTSKYGLSRLSCFHLGSFFRLESGCSKVACQHL